MGVVSDGVVRTHLVGKCCEHRLQSPVHRCCCLQPSSTTAMSPHCRMTPAKEMSSSRVAPASY